MDRRAWQAIVHGVAKSWTRLSDFTLTSCIGEGNGNPLQCSCLENPRDREAWCAAVYGVTQSWTQLKRLSTHAHIVNNTPFLQLWKTNTHEMSKKVQLQKRCLLSNLS